MESKINVVEHKIQCQEALTVFAKRGRQDLIEKEICKGTIL